MKIAIIGLGYVGLPLAVKMGEKFDVVGFDINENRITQLNHADDVTGEITTQELLESDLTYTTDIQLIKDRDVYIVTVPTPVTYSKQPDFGPLISASSLVGSVLQSGNIVIYESTVYPGATEEICVPALEKASGLKYNTEFFCGYSPERINPGDKNNTVDKIVKVTSGSNEHTSKIVDDIYGSVITAGTFRAASMKVAEASKVVENTQRDINIAFMNEISQICYKQDINVYDVLEAASTKWNFLPFTPGLVGGHCIGVDPYYLLSKSSELNVNAPIIRSSRETNDSMAEFAANKFVKTYFQKYGNLPNNIAIFGVTFKPNCPDIRNSQVFKFMEVLSSWKIKLKILDPIADPTQVENITGLQLSTTFDDLKTDAIILSVPHQEYSHFEMHDFEKFSLQNVKMIFDMYACYRKNYSEIERYIPIVSL